MSDFKTGLRTYLLADTNITALIGQQVYSYPVPQDAATPYLILSRVSQTPYQDDTATEDLEMLDETWQVDIIADSDLIAEPIQIAVYNRLHRADRVEMGSYFVQTSTFSRSNDDADIKMNGTESIDARKILDFDIKRYSTVTT